MNFFLQPSKLLQRFGSGPTEYYTQGVLKFSDRTVPVCSRGSNKKQMLYKFVSENILSISCDKNIKHKDSNDIHCCYDKM